VAGSICVLTTVGTLRTAGLTLMRTPAFAWSMLVASSIWLVTLPVLAGNVLLIYLDTDYGQQSFGQPALMWPQLQWIAHQPAVLAVAIPVLGIAGDVVPVIGRSKVAVRGALLGTIGAFGVLTFGPWAQTAFNPRLVNQAVFIGFSILVGLPVLGFLGGMADTLRRGKPQGRAALPLALLGVLATLVACAAAAARVIDPLNLEGTLWGAGVAKLAVGAAVAGVVAGVHYWGPKMYGVHPNEGLGKLNVLLVLGGIALFGGGDLLAGGVGQLPSGADGAFAEVADGAEIGLLLSAAGAVLLLLAVALALLVQLPAMGGKGVYAGADPWAGHTLEWTTASPPPYGNFLAAVPEVTSATPLLDAREENA
jgi:heme/copper-type cytochrome/quinol oxidase subunit 1